MCRFQTILNQANCAKVMPVCWVGVINMYLFQRMLVAALIALAVTATVSCNDDAEWLSWKQRYNKVYETEVWEDFHRQIWQRNKAYVEEHNSKEDVTFKMELNQFADQVAGSMDYCIVTFHFISRYYFKSVTYR